MSTLRKAYSGVRELTECYKRFIKEPRFVEIAVEVALLVLDLYSHALGQSLGFDRLVGKLKVRVGREVENSRAAWKTVGMLRMLLAGTAVA